MTSDKEQYESSLSDLHNKLIEILKVFSDFCIKNKLRFYAYGGTLLGAIRHNGIIPWDDDIDICMPREDYNRLLLLIEKEDSIDRYRFINSHTDPFFGKAFTRLMDTHTTEIPIKEAVYKYSMGCFIDIIPLDFIPTNKVHRQLYFKSCQIFLAIIRACSRYQNGINENDYSTLKRLLLTSLHPLFKYRLLTIQNVNDLFQQYLSNQKGREFGNSTIVPGAQRWIFDCRWFDHHEMHIFEDTYVPVPTKYDAILTKQYGDYMIPVKEPTSHGVTIVETHIPYMEYKEKHKDTLAQLYKARRKI